MKKYLSKTQKKFLIDPALDDKLKELKDLLNKDRNNQERKKVSENDLLESILMVFLDFPPEYAERAIEYREYVLALEEVDRLLELGADQVPSVVMRALDAKDVHEE